MCRYNWANLPRNDATLDASSHKHGRMTMQKPHPSIRGDAWSTTQRVSFKKPFAIPSATIRNSSFYHPMPFDDKLKVSWRTSTKASGFGHNAETGDGKGLIPERVLHSDMTRTEYRMRYNKEKPFHKSTITMNTGILPRRELVYDKE